MSTYENNVSYHPEKWGLTVVAELEFSDECYCFDTRIVWKDVTGKLFTARDSGCSCPTPFEDFNTMQDIDTFNFQELEREIEEDLKTGYSKVDPLKAREFLKTVKDSIFLPYQNT